MRKASRKTIVRKLDKLCGDIVKGRDGKCVICGTREKLTPGHIFSRIAYSTRWDLQNIATQCQSCNFRHESDPYPLFNWFTARYGIGALDELHKRYVTPRKFKTYQLEELYQSLQLLYGNR